MTGVFDIFRAKCRELMVGERGSALAITLMFLLPTYLFVIAIYGISETVRRKVELQNAADAAAYSAATVQADYLSRIAVLNKAIAWTYADMTRRQLDWAMASFTSQTIDYFNEDYNLAQSKNAAKCHMHTPGLHWSAGYSPEFAKAMWGFVLRAIGTSFGIPRLLEGFNDQGLFTRIEPILDIRYLIEEIRGKGVLMNSINLTKREVCLAQCTAKLAKYIVEGEMKKEIEKAANDILDLNTREIDDEVLRYVRVGDPNSYLTPLFNTEDGERKVLQHALTFDNDQDYDQARFFDKGIGYWFKRNPAGILGVIRGYHQTKEHLHTTWSYFWTQWKHIQILWIGLHLPPIVGGDIGYVKDRDYAATNPRYTGFTEGMPLFLGYLPAVVYTLNEPISAAGIALGTLFGKEGTILVGLARKNTNPLALFRSGGITSAFDPSVCGAKRPDYIWALSAARAAYNGKYANPHVSGEVQDKLKNPSYRIDYTAPSSRKELWNLREADWDAMFVPVRHADSLTMTGVFAPSMGSVLKDVMTDKKGWKRKKGDKWESADVDWSKLEPPGGFDGGGKLKWDECDKYLHH